MVHYFASRADKYRGIGHHSIQRHAISTAVSGTARFGTMFLRADKPGKRLMAAHERSSVRISSTTSLNGMTPSYTGNNNVQQGDWKKYVLFGVSKNLT